MGAWPRARSGRPSSLSATTSGSSGSPPRLSLRQLAEQAGVSNPYLSQIERGLRRPSAEVLQQIAKALRISAEQLYVRAGIVSPDDGVGGSVELADPRATPGSPSGRSSRCSTSTRRSSPSTRDRSATAS